MEKLEVQVRPTSGPTFTVGFEGDELTIGRSRDCDVVIQDGFLSRLHVSLHLREGRVFVQDSSRNGTLVNGERLEASREIGVGDVVELNGHELSLVGDEDLSASDTVWTETAAIDELTSSGELPVLRGPDDLRDVAERLIGLNEIHEALSVAHVGEVELLDLVLESACRILKTDMGAIFLRHGPGSYEPAVRRSLPGVADIPRSRRLLRGVCEGGRVAVLRDLLAEASFSETESFAGSELRSLVAVPIPGEDLAIGALVLGSTFPARFRESDSHLLATVAAVASLKIRNERLLLEAALREAEEKNARDVQESLLPDRLPDLPGYELSADNLPSRIVSGDYYKVTRLPSTGRWALLLIDVSGKGMPSALLTHSLDAFYECELENDQSPEVACDAVSRRLYARTLPNRFATVFLGLLDADGGSMRYCNAAHVPGLLLRRAGSVERLGPTGHPIGLLPEPTLQREEVVLDPGDLLALVSDGLTEAESPTEEEFGLDRLEAFLCERRDWALDDLAEAVHARIAEFTVGAAAHDDRTILLLRRNQLAH
jgi:sigma-B regulation protein RsbU (phosphoserine phosphatase)